MKTLEEMIAVMQWALENPEKDLAFDGQPIMARSASWDWGSYDYNIPSKYQIAPGHNPNKLTVEQVGEGWRLLTEEERKAQENRNATNEIQAWTNASRWDKTRCDGSVWEGNSTRCTYRTQKPEGYFLPKEPTYRDWTIAEVPLGWWFKNKHNGVTQTIERCYPGNDRPLALWSGNWTLAELRKDWLCTSSNTPLAPDTVWSVCGVEV